VKLCHVCGRSVSQDPDASMTVRDDWNGFGSPPPEAILYLCGECDSEAVSPLTPLYQTPTQSPVRAALLPSVCPVAAFEEALALPIGGRPKQGLKTAGVGE
jgi:hypothetical protein